MFSYSGEILPFLNLDFTPRTIALVAEQHHDDIIRGLFLSYIVRKTHFREENTAAEQNEASFNQHFLIVSISVSTSHYKYYCCVA